MKPAKVTHTVSMRLSIGELSAVTKETVKTLRYWTDLGLLEAVRGENGYRYYQKEVAERAAFIRRAQALGFSLGEIADILASRGSGLPPCAEVRERLAAHLATVRARISELSGLEAELTARLRWAEAHPEPQCEADGCVYLSG
jgi:MerR family transcriptional regulator, copper efflux regulator